ncbi:hypothetical protein QEZ48_14655 [Aquamicrobium lusatiense]|uniref:head-tail connector protein n=1 Tax=Aquamicrobium lusatiense TaxID=89772 RepID=UPI002454EBD2|nr:hypothetical protein [Aquamicrobium lusatiense]MDH4992058.1 hypothetical protein [Aquamicrobium lusatiense]
MHRPVLVKPPEILPVTLDEMKQALRIVERDASGAVLPHEDDDLIEDEIQSAVSHYEGWTGILGIALCEQGWRQDFDRFDSMLCLPIGPALHISAVRWRNKAGQMATVNEADYARVTDAAGQSSVRFGNSFVFPTDLYEGAAVQVDYRAGWPIIDGHSTVPADLKAAIKMRVQAAYDEASRDASLNLQRIEKALVSKWRRSVL